MVTPSLYYKSVIDQPRNEAMRSTENGIALQQLRKEGKNGTGEVFVTPTEVELAKTVHACRATATFDYASSKLFARRTVFGSGTGQSILPCGCGKNAAPPVLPFPTTMFAQRVALPSKQNHDNKKDLQKGPQQKRGRRFPGQRDPFPCRSNIGRKHGDKQDHQ